MNDIIILRKNRKIAVYSKKNSRKIAYSKLEGENISALLSPQPLFTVRMK